MCDSRYLDWFVEATPASVKHWLGDDPVRQALEADLERTVEARTNLGDALRYRSSCPVADAIDADYCLREIRLFDGDVAVLAGIHFFGGDVGRPFVGIEAQTRQLTSDELVAASLNLLEEFELFSPSATWWWRTGRQVPVPGVATVADQRFVVGSIEDFRRRSIPASDLAVSLDRAADDGSYAVYSDMFDRYLAGNPQWTGRLQKTTREDYARCAEAGGLYLVGFEGACAGIMAASPGILRGLPGWIVMEELFDDPLRGRGAAAHVQRRFLDQLDPTRGKLVMGTIDAANLPSLRTAQKVGRFDGGGWSFLLRPGERVSPAGIQAD